MRQSSVPMQTSGNEEFERSLRRMLVSRAPAAAPRELHTSISAVTQEGPGVMRRVWTPLRGGYGGGRISAPAVGMAFVMVVVLVVGVGTLGLVLTRPPNTPGGAALPQSIQLACELRDPEGSLSDDRRRWPSLRRKGSTQLCRRRSRRSNYRTLEIVWLSGAQEMRLNIYLKSDGVNWWASEIRTYDGQPKPNWITYDGPELRTRVGAAFQGDLNVSSNHGAVPGHLVISGLTLDAFQPGDGPSGLENCTPVRPMPGNNPPGMGDADPMAAGEPLAGAGLEAMSPKANPECPP